MKKFLFIALVALSINSFAQTDKPERNKLDCYVAGSLSTSGGNNFNQSSYPSLEIGACFKNLTFGFASGRNNLDKSPYINENISNYYFEIKSYASAPIGSAKGFVVVGWGQTYNSMHNFIEYGAGFSYSIKKFDISVTASSWDKTVYISPGITYNFKL